MAFYREGRAQGSFDDGIQHALARVLVDPEFLFRVERDPSKARAGARLSHQRPRARLAAVVLPVEQHSRTTSCSTPPPRES